MSQAIMNRILSDASRRASNDDSDIWDRDKKQLVPYEKRNDTQESRRYNRNERNESSRSRYNGSYVDHSGDEGMFAIEESRKRKSDQSSKINQTSAVAKRKYARSTNYSDFDYRFERDEYENGNETDDHQEKSDEDKDQHANSVGVILPGAQITGILPKNNEPIGVLDKRVVQGLRDYLNIVFGAVTISRREHKQMRLDNSQHCVADIVNAILRYNGVFYEKIKAFISPKSLPEPLWFFRQNNDKELWLFIDVNLYDAHCTRFNDNRVIVTSGIVPLEKLNPDHMKMTSKIDLVEYNVVVMCDHLCQHILDSIYNQNPLPGGQLHDDFGRYGITMHSMLDLTDEHPSQPLRLLPEISFPSYDMPGTSSSSSRPVNARFFDVDEDYNDQTDDYDRVPNINQLLRNASEYRRSIGFDL